MAILQPKELEPIPYPVFETWESLQSVITAAQQELPEMTENRLRSLFMTYHNTLLSKVNKLY